MPQNEELTEVAKEYEARLQQMEEDRNRRNRETMENLQTLLKEMTYIEEVNDTLNKELAEEREQHKQTKEQLATRFSWKLCLLILLVPS